MMFLLGVIVGAAAMFALFFWLGTSERFKKYDTPQGPQVYYHKPEPCKNGHKWCQEHAAKGQYHCTVCPYTMEQ